MQYATYFAVVARYARGPMSDTKDRWHELAAQAADEHDPRKMLALLTEINNLFSEKFAEKVCRLKEAPKVKIN